MDKKALKETTIIGLVYRFAERISAQLVSTIISIILARLLTPEDYGVISLVTVLITIGNVFVDSGFGAALVQKKNPDKLDYSTVLCASLIISFGLYIIAFSIAPFVARYYENDTLTPIFRIMALRLPIAGMNTVQNAYISKHFMFKKFFWATLSGTLGSGILGIVLAYCGYGSWALVAQYISSVTINTIALALIINLAPSFKFSWARFKSMLSFGINILISGLATAIYEEARSLIIAKMYSVVDLSYYTKGKQFPGLLANNVSTTIRNVMFPVLSVYQDDKKGMKKAVRRSIRVCSYIIFPMLIGFAAISKTFVLVVLTEKWLPIIPYTYIFCALYIFKPLKNINQSSLKALGRGGLYLAINIFEKTFGIVLIIFTMRLGVIYLAFSAVIVYSVTAILEMTANGVVISYNFLEQIKDFLPHLLMSLVMGGIVYYIPLQNINPVLALCIQICSGILSYLGLSILVRSETLRYLSSTIKTVLSKRSRNGNTR